MTLHVLYKKETCLYVVGLWRGLPSLLPFESVRNVSGQLNLEQKIIPDSVGRQFNYRRQCSHLVQYTSSACLTTAAQQIETSVLCF
jgi:hypothetical protein